MASSRKRSGDGDEYSSDQKRRNSGDLESGDDYFEVEESDDDEINIITATGKIIPVTVKGSDTIDKIKLKIQAKKHIPFDQLFFKQKAVENNNMFAHLPIKKESTSTLMGEMYIFIKNLEGRVIYSLKVKPSDTIGNVKIRMCVSRHVLMFNGVVLEDNGTLADFNLVNGSTLTRVDISKGRMEIFVNILNRKTISLLVTPTDTIANVKLEIMYRECVPIDEQVLIFNGMALGDSGTLFDFDINGKSTLTLVRRSRGLMQIFIKTFKRGTVTIEVNPSHTIRNVKSKIQDEIHIPHDEQELIFNEMVLHNNDTLVDYNIKKGSTLTLVRISIGYMHIFIKTQSGKTINMKVKPSDTIYNVRSKIGNAEGVPQCQIILLFEGKHLEDGATLADYHVRNESTIDSMLIQRGG